MEKNTKTIDRAFLNKNIFVIYYSFIVRSKLKGIFYLYVK